MQQQNTDLNAKVAKLEQAKKSRRFGLAFFFSVSEFLVVSGCQNCWMRFSLGRSLGRVLGGGICWVKTELWICGNFLDFLGEKNGLL